MQETFLKAEASQFTVLALMYLHQFKGGWSRLQSLVQVESQRQIKGGTFSQEKRSYISSLPIDAPLIANAIRAHWRIENNLHWSLDLRFREDQSRIRKAHAPENVSWLRRIALSLLKKECSLKANIRRKRFKALMVNHYLKAVLQAC